MWWTLNAFTPHSQHEYHGQCCTPPTQQRWAPPQHHSTLCNYEVRTPPPQYLDKDAMQEVMNEETITRLTISMNQRRDHREERFAPVFSYLTLQQDNNVQWKDSLHLFPPAHSILYNLKQMLHLLKARNFAVMDNCSPWGKLKALTANEGIFSEQQTWKYLWYVYCSF